MNEKLNNIAFYIQARTGSTRLPGKVLLPFENNSSILEIIVNKLLMNFPEIPLVICTSINANDDVIEEFSKRKNISVFRGSENNVLNRFVEAAEKFNNEVIIRICSDNPFLDMSFIRELFELYRKYPNADYWSFKGNNNIPVIKMHFGIFAEIVTKKALQKVAQETSDLLYQEHVTNYIYTHDGFNCILKLLPDFFTSREYLRFTVDDKEDFMELKKVYHFYRMNSNDIIKTILFVENNKIIFDKMAANINKYSK